MYAIMTGIFEIENAFYHLQRIPRISSWLQSSLSPSLLSVAQILSGLFSRSSLKIRTKRARARSWAVWLLPSMNFREVGGRQDTQTLYLGDFE